MCMCVRLQLKYLYFSASVPMDILVLSMWLCVSRGVFVYLQYVDHFCIASTFLELSSLRETERQRESEREGRGGWSLSKFKQAQNKRPVEAKV